MNRNDILKKYTKPDDKLLIAKVLDKIEHTKKYNKVEHTDFLDLYQNKIVKQLLEELKLGKFIFYGGQENVERQIVFFYPEKLEEVEKNSIYSESICGIRILLPNENLGKYTHRDYLGAIMKLGVKREKIGDILVDNQGADIIVLKEISKYLCDSLKNLTRFSKANIKIIDISEIKEVKINKKELKIIVSSLRLDSIVSELAKTSRVKANEIIKEERVFINFENETKITKQLKEKDIITIRGKGRFEIKEIQGNTKKGNIILSIEQNI